MKTKEQIEDLRNALGGFMELHREGRLTMTDEDHAALCAAQNTLCAVLEDGSTHAEVFNANVERLMKVCIKHGVRFIKPITRATQ